MLQQRVLLWLHGHGDGELLHQEPGLPLPQPDKQLLSQVDKQLKRNRSTSYKQVDQQQLLSQEEALSCIINSIPAKKINLKQQLFSQ
jgi:hypothetical protein